MDDLISKKAALDGYVLEGDNLYAYRPVPNMPDVVEKELVMTKEEFVLCWELWIAPKEAQP